MNQANDPHTPRDDGPGQAAGFGRPALRPGLHMDPAAAMLGLGAVVLVVAVWWLWSTPPDQIAAAEERRLAALEQRLAGLDAVREQIVSLNARLQALAAVEQRLFAETAEQEGRLRALEVRQTLVDPQPLAMQVAGLADRLAAAERMASQVAERTSALEAQPRLGPGPWASRQALDLLAARVQAVEAAVARPAVQREAAPEWQFGERIGALEQQVNGRLAVLEQQVAQRAEALSAQHGQRTAALEQQIAQRLDGLEQLGPLMEQRLAAAEQLRPSLAALDQVERRLAELDQRTARLGALNAVQGALAAAIPLRAALDRLPNPPAALTRFADAAPPTDAALRLAFEDAARAARTAADPAATGPEGERGSVGDAALSRLGALVTIRRGEQVVWGDAAEAEIERARRALQAGDIDLALANVDRLPPAARQAMASWAGEARALLAARAALRQLLTAG